MKQKIIHIRYYFFILILLGKTHFLVAQTEGLKKLDINNRKHHITIQSGVHTSLIALGYEHFFKISNHFFISGMIGVGYNEELKVCLFGACAEPRIQMFTLPLFLGINYGHKKWFAELGVGSSLGRFDWRGETINYVTFALPQIGVRYVPLKKHRPNAKLSLGYPLQVTQLLNQNSDLPFFLFLPVGLSIGYQF